MKEDCIELESDERLGGKIKALRLKGFNLIEMIV
jgi:hypothetical protein